MNPTSLSVVIPVYNEGACIQRNLEKIAGYLSSKFSRFEVIVVDDGSTDDTRKKLAEVARQDGQIRIVSFSINHGKGFAVKQGMLKARGGIALFTDADLSTPIEETEKALEELSKGYSLVIASRQHPDSIIFVRQSYARETMGKLFNLIVRTLFRLPFRDTQCGFKCFSQKATKKIFSGARIDDLTFDVEALLIALRRGYLVKEIPICWTNAPTSKVRLIKDSLRIAKELYLIFFNDLKGLYGHKS